MAIGMIFTAQVMTQSQYQQVRDAVMPGNQLPAGSLFHAAGPAQDGWRVVEIWESREAIDRFFQNTLGAALTKAGIDLASPHVTVQWFDVANMAEQ